MVARSSRDTQRRNWRHHGRECGTSDQSWRGLHRCERRGVETQTGPRRSRFAALCTLFGAFALIAPFNAVTSFAAPAINAAETAANFEAALNAYQDGKPLQALSLAKTSARAGNSDAAVLAGHILRKGEAGSINLTEARKWFEQGALKGHPDALVALGEMGLLQQAGLSHKDSLSYLLRAAESGRTDAMRALADMYRTGQGTQVNKAESEFWLRKAAQSFDSKGAKALGDSLFETDPEAALAAYEQAANAGDIEAAYIAGVMYAENYDIRPNEQKSVNWLRMAAEGGHPAAMADYGLLVYQGVASKPSQKEAAAWFQKSAQKGDSEGQFLYAFTLAKGEGVTQNFEEAYFWVLKSIKSAETIQGSDLYDKDRKTLRTGLEGRLSPETQSRVKARL